MSEAWDPGIVSPVPRHLLHLCTIFRPENVFTSFPEARELHGLTGLDYADLVAFRPGRLALHELLIRVSADFSVPDGRKIEDLGINFRRIVNDMLARAIVPHRVEIEARYAEIRKSISGVVKTKLAGIFDASANAPAKTVGAWKQDAQRAAAPLERAACLALAKVVGALLVQHGRVWGTPELVETIVTSLACNEHGGEEIGTLIDPWIKEAARALDYKLLPDQPQPMVMNTKGASASGKSTIRPLQRRLSGELGTDWSDFALISPDIWRKQLLDYASLGDAYKYAGAFTGDELQIVDQKLDQYMAWKASRGRMTHLLIDRFRFDSFAPDSEVAGSNLLTRFGQIVYLFFMITPPDALVERAWRRGLDVGRYKSVDDTLAHSVQAYSGMPELFFTWIARRDKRVHFEFLDNTVELGERPRTVSFGWNESLTVLDVKSLLDVERFRRVDTNARAPGELFRDRALLAPERNTAFLTECVSRFREVNFAEQATGQIYLRLESGAPSWIDREALERALSNADTKAGLAAAAPRALDAAATGGAAPDAAKLIATERPHTVGQWGP